MPTATNIDEAAAAQTNCSIKRPPDVASSASPGAPPVQEFGERAQTLASRAREVLDLDADFGFTPNTVPSLRFARCCDPARQALKRQVGCTADFASEAQPAFGRRANEPATSGFCNRLG